MKGVQGFQKGHTYGAARINPNRPTSAKNYAIRIYEDQIEELSAIAEKENKFSSEIFREALDCYFRCRKQSA